MRLKYHPLSTEHVLGSAGWRKMHIGWRWRSREGYVYKRTSRGFELEHRLVAERALGKALPDGAIVHHINECKDDNRGCNLLVCPDREYHNALHSRLIQQQADDKILLSCPEF